MNAQCSECCVLSDNINRCRLTSTSGWRERKGKEKKERKDGDVAIVRNGNSETVKCKWDRRTVLQFGTNVNRQDREGDDYAAFRHYMQYYKGICRLSFGAGFCVLKFVSTYVNIKYTEMKLCLMFCMSVKLGLSISERNIGWGFLRIGCWGEFWA